MQKQINKLIEYIVLLDQWNEKINLVSYKDIKDLIINHIIDSLSLLECIRFRDQAIADIGTGPGLPGLVLSLFMRDNFFTLIEPKKKYFRFLKKVIFSLKIDNIKLIPEQVEDIKTNDISSIMIFRAVSTIKDIIRKRNIRNSDILIFYKGYKVFHELVSLPQEQYKILFIKKIKILEKYNKNHYIIALKKRYVSRETE